jgi:N-acetylglucosaminyl-diphospho-decaprenol L-rhamnosyltransferase
VSDRPTVSVTVVLHNSADRLRECLEPLRASVESGFAEVIAVDNASPDDSASIVRSVLPSARVVVSDVNRGFAGGVGLAWPEVRGTYWLLLNPDIVVPPEGLERLCAWMDGHPDLGVASPELTDASVAMPGSVGRALPSLGLALLEVTRLHRLLGAGRRASLYGGPYWTGGDQLDAGWVPGAAALARRSAVEQAGPPSERFFMYGEDVEWCWRVRRAGWRVGTCASVRFEHAQGASARATWDAAELERRRAAGTFAAVAVMRGRRYARLYAGLTAVSLALQARSPRMDAEQKGRLRAAARAWRRAGR